MDRFNAHITAGTAAADARVRIQPGLGYGWPTATFPRNNSAFAMAVTSNKCQPRRLGQRST